MMKSIKILVLAAFLCVAQASNIHEKRVFFEGDAFAREQQGTQSLVGTSIASNVKRNVDLSRVPLPALPPLPNYPPPLSIDDPNDPHVKKKQQENPSLVQPIASSHPSLDRLAEKKDAQNSRLTDSIHDEHDADQHGSRLQPIQRETLSLHIRHDDKGKAPRDSKGKQVVEGANRFYNSDTDVSEFGSSSTTLPSSTHGMPKERIRVSDSESEIDRDRDSNIYIIRQQKSASENVDRNVKKLAANVKKADPHQKKRKIANKYYQAVDKQYVDSNPCSIKKDGQRHLIFGLEDKSGRVYKCIKYLGGGSDINGMLCIAKLTSGSHLIGKYAKDNEFVIKFAPTMTTYHQKLPLHKQANVLKSVDYEQISMSTEAAKAIQKEWKILSILDHKNIIKPLELVYHPTCTVMVLPHKKGGIYGAFRKAMVMLLLMSSMSMMKKQENRLTSKIKYLVSINLEIFLNLYWMR